MISERSLHPLNPLDHLCLLYWLFFAPNRLAVYREEKGEQAVNRLGTWLSGTFLWLPLLLIAVGKSWVMLGLGVLGWLVGGWLGEQTNGLRVIHQVVLGGVIAAGVGIAFIETLWMTFYVPTRFMNVLLDEPEPNVIVASANAAFLLAFVASVSIAYFVATRLASKTIGMMSTAMLCAMLAATALSAWSVLFLGWVFGDIFSVGLSTLTGRLGIILFVDVLSVIPLGVALRTKPHSRMYDKVILQIANSSGLLTVWLLSCATLIWVTLLGGGPIILDYMYDYGFTWQ